ncbi:Putative acyl-CoA dehydrogenase [gamma proteobacterium HdN1]|nr:Putative acyl-CoA dehydrogenase [gamma proteobacterium HdN1]
MIEWTETQQMIRRAVRQFIDAEIAPRIMELEHSDTPPYDVLRKMVKTFGMDVMATQQFQKQIAKERAQAAGTAESEPKEKKELSASEKAARIAAKADQEAMRMLPIIELCRYCPGLVTAMGVSIGLAGGAIQSKGTLEQKERWALPLLTLEKIGAWAITEPNSGSDAFGGMKSLARRTSDGQYVLNGNKTFITNGPYADTIIFICRLDEPDVPPPQRKVLSFILDKGMPGLTQSAPFKKMGIHSSPTGELFLQDVVVGKDRLLGGSEEGSGRSGAKDTFTTERSGVAAMALGIIERCLELSVKYAKERVQFGRPISEFQLIQLKLAKMEVARVNLQNMVFRHIELLANDKRPTLAEASAMKLYAAQAAVEVALEAVQIHGGNGYMVEYHVEQLLRDSKILQIYGGTDEIQITHIARDLLTREG